MLDIYGETDVNECLKLWEHFVPRENLTDLWDVRACFLREFNREPFFVVAREKDRPVGLLPLSYIPEQDYYGYFPGEVWQGKTWLEQNRVIVPDGTTLEVMLRWLAGEKKKYALRYLVRDEKLVPGMEHVDEIGYVFRPKDFGYSMDNYYSMFSGKSLKKIMREVSGLYDRGVVIRKDEAADFEIMVRMNTDRFGERSYFADSRFQAGFRTLRDYLLERGMLKMTTVMVEGRPAAVDMGCVYNGVYTLLGGGTEAGYPGIAKLINLHHMETSCAEKYAHADFLCGDFSWKKLFHLTEKPLYEVKNLE